MAQTRKTFYSRTVSLTGGAAVSLASLMNANGFAELDNPCGYLVVLKPASATLYIGDDANVRDAAGVGVYQGYPVGSGVEREIYDESVDPNKIFLYSVGTQNVAIIFNGS